MIVLPRFRIGRERFIELLTSYARLCFLLTRSHFYLTVQFRNFKIVYRRYAGLYFCICVDLDDNNLAYLEAIHNFVEVLNEFFHNVCELDLVFNFYKVCMVTDHVKSRHATFLFKFFLSLSLSLPPSPTPTPFLPSHPSLSLPLLLPLGVCSC